jgi:hypothetical protein
MEKSLEVSDMPPLTVEMHSKLRSMENKLWVELDSCCTRGRLTDPEGAFEYTRTYAAKFYDCFFDFYSQIPNLKYRPHWRPASERFAHQRVVKCIGEHDSIHTFFQTYPDRVARIILTIKQHAERNTVPSVVSAALTGKQISAYNRAGIDMASASPLLLMVHAAAQESERRGGTAPTPATPKRRIPRSIHSESAAKKLEDYLNAKGLSQTQFAIQINVNQKTLYRFRTTGNVGKSVAQDIAQAMGITLEEFISR